jgi:hypothetical protein
MRFRAFSIDFIQQGGIQFPANTLLHKLAIEYAEANISKQFNLADLRKVLVVCEIDENDQPVKVHALSGCQLVIDWPVLRFTDKEAGQLLMERMRAYLQDQGLSGIQTFVHVAKSEPKESRCPAWKQFLKKNKAENASRWSVQV